MGIRALVSTYFYTNLKVSETSLTEKIDKNKPFHRYCESVSFFFKVMYIHVHMYIIQYVKSCHTTTDIPVI